MASANVYSIKLIFDPPARAIFREAMALDDAASRCVRSNGSSPTTEPECPGEASSPELDPRDSMAC